MLNFHIYTIYRKLQKMNSEEHIKFCDSRYNRIHVIGNLKIQDGGRQPC